MTQTNNTVLPLLICLTAFLGWGCDDEQSAGNGAAIPGALGQDGLFPTQTEASGMVPGSSQAGPTAFDEPGAVRTGLEEPAAEDTNGDRPAGVLLTPGSGAVGGSVSTQPAPGTLGAACSVDMACDGGICITSMPGGYCSQGCENSDDCAQGSCWNLGLDTSVCLLPCDSSEQCRTSEGYFCDGDNTCFPGDEAPSMGTGSTGGSGPVPVGASCASSADCGATGQCIPEQSSDGATGFIGGYCIQRDCSDASPCPAGSSCFSLQGGGSACLASCNDVGDCRAGYACEEGGACMPGCTEGSCPSGQVCRDDGICGEPPCTADSCASGTICGESGRCIIDLGEVPGGAIPSCGNVASWSCDGGEANCGGLIQFEPVEGPGYVNYPLNGETWNDQYRSFVRRDTLALVAYAAGQVDCLAEGWDFGVRAPLGLGDMSEADGGIPGSREGRPGHPEGTHVNGFDMDIAYYQLRGNDNHLRSVCEHYLGGQDAYRCVSVPDNLDVWRTALFLGRLHDSPQLRVIGVDGQIGELIESAMDQLCNAGWLSGRACSANLRSIAYETEDQGRGWFRFHHHHFHMSITGRAQAGLQSIRYSSEALCLRSDCGDVPDFQNDPRRRNFHEHDYRARLNDLKIVLP